MVKFGGKIGTLYQMLKNAFKKHPLQNRTNVQIKGGGGQRPFEQCSKKLHFFEMGPSLMPPTQKIKFSDCQFSKALNFRIRHAQCPVQYLIKQLKVHTYTSDDWQKARLLKESLRPQTCVRISSGKRLVKDCRQEHLVIEHLSTWSISYRSEKTRWSAQPQRIAAVSLALTDYKTQSVS